MMLGRHRVAVTRFDHERNRWSEVDSRGAVERADLTLATFNIWYDDCFADQRYGAIADLLSETMPDVMVFQEVTPAAVRIFSDQPWIRAHYLRAAAAGDGFGNYGLLMLSRLPLNRVTYTRLPTRLRRGFLRAELMVNGQPHAISSVHLDSGKGASRLRARQLRRLFRAHHWPDDAIILGDFNMRDSENPRIAAGYRDIWPAVRPDHDGYTEDTAVNLMRWDAKPKHRQVRFDRVLVKGRGWAPSGIELLGTEPVSDDLPRIFPSDHFGLRCRLVSRPVDDGIGRPARHRPSRIPAQ